MQNILASSDEEAQERFQRYKGLDPFPNIKPALLNSADIFDYVVKTSMIYPFDSEKLKSASYEVSLLGKVIFWDGEGKKRPFDIQRGETFTLEKNSIAFVTPEPTFRLPDYIALRFNLKITHVHRGILLGTGPLIDPGYEGKLFIPLHNLTKNDYKFRGGEDLIWVEFTKISENNKRWTNYSKDEDKDRIGKYVDFPIRKKYQEPESSIAKALKDQDSDSIRSSLPDIVEQAKREAERSKQEARASAKSANSIKRRVTIGGIIAGLALLFALAAVVISVFQALTGATSLINDTRSNLDNVKSVLEERLKSQDEEIRVLRTEIQSLKKEKSPQRLK
jgi:deoxycytidine triphosphate deaminase